MKINYNLNEEDFEIFFKYMMTNNTNTTNKFNIKPLFISIIIILFYYIYLWYENGNIQYYSFLFTILVFLFFHFFYYKKNKSNNKKINIKIGASFINLISHLLGENSLEIKDNKIINISKYQKTNIDISYFSNIVETDKYIYLILQKNIGYVIPKETSNGDTKEVFDYLRGFTKQKN